MRQPQSTLLLLVSAFVKGDWKKIYQAALAKRMKAGKYSFMPTHFIVININKTGVPELIAGEYGNGGMSCVGSRNRCAS
jgi:hypothetical protein